MALGIQSSLTLRTRLLALSFATPSSSQDLPTMRPTALLLRDISRKPLTTKQANKGYYKGNRTGSMGRHTKRGGYVIEWVKVRTYVVPPEFKMFKVSTVYSTPPIFGRTTTLTNSSIASTDHFHEFGFLLIGVSIAHPLCHEECGASERVFWERRSERSSEWREVS